MKKIITLVCFIAISASTYSQNSLFSINYTPAFLTGDMKDYIGDASWRGWGIEARFFPSQNFSAGFMVGYNGFFEKRARSTYELDEDRRLTAVTWRYLYSLPIMAKVDYYLTDDGIRPYIGLGIGTTYNEHELQVSTLLFSNKKWKFGFYPEIGAVIPFGPLSDVGITIAGRYHYTVYNETFLDTNFSNIGYFSFALGFTFLGF